MGATFETLSVPCPARPRHLRVRALTRWRVFPTVQGDLWGDMQPSGPRGSARGTYCAPEALGAGLVDPACPSAPTTPA